MSLLLSLLLFVASLILLVKSSNWVLKGAQEVGYFLRLSPFVIGVVLLGLGTSLPELAASLAAVWQGKGEVVVANIVGSNVANIFLIVGLTALLSWSLSVQKRILKIDVPLLLGGTVLFLVLAADQKITSVEGVLLFSLAILLLFYYAFWGKKKELVKESKEKKGHLKSKELSQLIFGLTGLAVGAHYLILSLTQVASHLGLAESLIAVTALAVGTSLPELAVSLRAALAKKPALSLGNIFGSNLFNLLLVGGLSASFRPLFLDSLTMEVGLPVLALATFLFLLVCLFRKIYFWEGGLFLLLYFFFIVLLV
jgi:cation:H+ antiporter